jgi:pyrimidine deaminase RibD-like protein
MISTTPRRLVTVQGECFEVSYHGSPVSGSRDGVVHHFHLRDLKTPRDVLRISVFRGGVLDAYVPSAMEFDRRENTVVLNVIRRAFDRGDVSFDRANGSVNYTEISLEPSDFAKSLARTDKEIASYITHKAYLLSYRYPTQSTTTRPPIPFAEEIDLDYLGVGSDDVRRIVERMAAQGMLEAVMETDGRPAEKLLASYESEDADDAKFARQALDQARKSVSEPDGKIHPKVGAVVVKNGKVLSQSHRGELPQNHAEFIALERKLPDDAVSGATVYTTLEPCTTRNHPKIPCTDRLIERKVARVVVGMLDPDMRITGRGIRKLRDANIVIDFFPSDIMKEVEELNREFTRFCEQQNNARNSDGAKLEAQVAELKRQNIELSRKPYDEFLGKKVEILISRLSTVGKRLMRHLVEREPLEVGRSFFPDVSGDIQFQQLSIAMEMGIIRHREVRVGSGMLLRTDYEINPQFVSVLRDLLYREE